MDKINVRDHPILIEYRDTMTRIISSAHPRMNKDDIEKAVEYSIQKRFKNFDLNIQNKYKNKNVQMTMLEMLDYIKKREPIITSYGTMFKKHEQVPNPMAKVIQSFLDLRKKHKKEMFKYPKGSEMFESFNLLQQLDWQHSPSIYKYIDENGVKIGRRLS